MATVPDNWFPPCAGHTAPDLKVRPALVGRWQSFDQLGYLPLRPGPPQGMETEKVVGDVADFPLFQRLVSDEIETPPIRQEREMAKN